MKVLTILFMLIFIVVGVIVVKTYQPTMNVIYPDQCAFIMDNQLSPSFQQQLQSYVTTHYHVSKDLDAVIDNVIKEFPEIIAVDAFVCRTDKLCFSMHATKPLFVLNDKIVGDNNQLFHKDHFAMESVDELHMITADDCQSLDMMRNFVSMVPQQLFKDFSVHWVQDQEIVVKDKEKKPNTLVFSVDNAPSDEAIELFKKISDTQGKKKKNKKTYDFRFKGQIIVK